MTQINKKTALQLLALSALPKGFLSEKESWKKLLWPFAMLALFINDGQVAAGIASKVTVKRYGQPYLKVNSKTWASFLLS